MLDNWLFCWSGSTEMSLARKTVKGVKYLYVIYHDPIARKKVEKYCGPASDPASYEKAKKFQMEYLELKNNKLVSEVDSNASKLTSLESPEPVASPIRNKRKYREAKPPDPTAPEYTLRAFRLAQIYNPEIHYKSSEQMREVEAGSVQLVITSPPYNVGKSYYSYNDNKDFQEYLAMLERVWRESKRVLCKGGRIAINVADTGRQPYLPLHVHITEQLLNLGFRMRGIVYWDKGASVGTSTAWGSWRSASNPTLRDVGESILIFCKDDYKLDSPNNVSTITSYDFALYSKSIWTFQTTSADKEGHPSPFPDELPRRLIKFYTFLGDTVLDPFLGSGTTCAVAKSLGRKSIGYELDESYRQTIEKKIKSVTDLTISADSLSLNGRPITESNFPLVRIHN